jgi:PAS domain S-box-containing protein
LLAIAAIGTAFSLAAYLLVRMDDLARVERAFLQRVEWLTRDLQVKLNDAADPLVATSLFIGTDSALYRTSFDRFADNARAIEPFVRSILWAPRVSAAWRAAFEMEQHDFGRPDFRISDRADDGSLVPAADREEHLPVVYERLFDFQPSIIGLDLMQLAPLARTAARARDTGDTLASRPIVLRIPSGAPSGMLIFQPVYLGGAVPAERADRRANLRGFVAGSLAFEPFLRQVLAGTLLAGEYLILSTVAVARTAEDLPEPADEVVAGVFEGRTGALRATNDTRDLLSSAGFVTERRVQALGRTWKLLHVQSEEAVDRARTFHERPWLLLGLALTALVCLFAYRQVVLRRAVLAAVVARTADLRRAHETLATSEVDRARAEREKEGATRMLAAIVDNAIDAIITIDERGIVLSYNRGAVGIFGHAPEDVIGRNVSMLMPEPDRFRHDGYVRRYTDTGERRIVGIGREVQAQRKDGTVFPAELAVSEMPAEDRRVFIGTLRDLTERKRLEAQLAHVQKMEAIGQLSGGIAHDFNNMLGAILGNLELASRENVKIERIHRLLAAATRVTHRAGDLVQRILAVSRRQMLHPERIDLAATLADVVPLLRRTLGEHVDVHSRVGPELWPIQVDPAQLESAILNLAINARDAMPKGGVLAIDARNVSVDHALVRAYPDLKEGPYVRLDMTDTGAGIPPEILSRVFEPFFTTKEAGRGTGLGLSMVYGFVRQSGGTVKIYSEPGHGTSLHLYFPRAPETSVASAPLETETDEPATGSASGRILVVEDNTDVTEVARAILEDLGYEVVTAANGQEALDILAQDAAFDLMLSDIVMPILGGLELAREVTQRYPAIRILMTSGFASPVAVREQAAELGYAVLPKPYRRAILAARVRALLEEAR